MKHTRRNNTQISSSQTLRRYVRVQFGIPGGLWPGRWGWLINGEKAKSSRLPVRIGFRLLTQEGLVDFLVREPYSCKMQQPEASAPTWSMDTNPYPATYNYYPPFRTINPPVSDDKYAVNSKIMVVAVAVLFSVVLFILCLHIYAKWFWRTQAVAAPNLPGSPTSLSWRRRRRYAHHGLHVSGNDHAGVPVQQQMQVSMGLDRAVVEALPTFEYKAAAMAKKTTMECAVCLEDFEETEVGRTLPKCGHSFHLDCIDMWLHSHSTCPLCRSGLQPEDLDDELMKLPPVLTLVETVVNVDDIDTPVESDAVTDVQGGGSVSPSVMRNSRSSRQQQQLAEVERTSSLTSEQQETEQSQSGKSTEIPSNVLFWGTNGNMESRPSMSLRAPFQISIDMPRASQMASSSSSSNASSTGGAMSPMARASASFRRLLSRGKGQMGGSPHPQGEESPGQGFESPRSGHGGPSNPQPSPRSWNVESHAIHSPHSSACSMISSLAPTIPSIHQHYS